MNTEPIRLELQDDELSEAKRVLRAALDKHRGIVARLEASLASLERIEQAQAPSDPKTRFFGIRLHKAAEILIREAGRPLAEDELIEGIIAGGGVTGKRTPVAQIKKSIAKSVETGRLLRKGKMIDLVEQNS